MSAVSAWCRVGTVPDWCVIVLGFTVQILYATKFFLLFSTFLINTIATCSVSWYNVFVCIFSFHAYSVYDGYVGYVGVWSGRV